MLENTSHHLYQYGILGSFYAEHVRGVRTTSCGTFEQRYGRYQGTPVQSKRPINSWRKHKSINFMGNVEAVSCSTAWRMWS